MIYFLITLFAFLLLSFQDSLHIFWLIFVYWGFPDSSVGEDSTCNAGDLGSIPGLGRSPGGGKALPTPVFWPGEIHGLYSPRGCKESDMTERLSLVYF